MKKFRFNDNQEMERDEMEKYLCRVTILLTLFFIIGGCFHKVPPFTGAVTGKWELMLNEDIKYTFDFDRRYFESAYRCEIGCSGQIASWTVDDGVLSGTTQCDMIYVTYEGKAGRDECEGIYKVHTLTGEFLREGVFKGKPI